MTEKDRLIIQAWYAIANLDYPRAIRAFREIIANHPLEVEAYWLLGRVLVSETQYEDAIEVYQQGLSVDAESKEICNSLGNVYLFLGRHDEAIAMHRQYVQLAPDDPNAHDSLGLSYQWAGRYSEAVQEYEAALRLKTDFEVALVHLGNTRFQMGRYADALRHYERYIQVVQTNQERARGYSSIANVYLKSGDLDRAERAAKKAISFDKFYFEASLTVALARGGLTTAQKTTAQKLNEQLIKSRPARGGKITPRVFHYFNGLLALLSGRDAEATEDFRQALRHPPTAWNIDSYEDCLANAYLKQGRLDEAIKEYERVLRLNPNYPLVHYHLAKAYEQKGNRNEVLAQYRRFLEIWKDADANIPEVLSARQSITRLS